MTLSDDLLAAFLPLDRRRALSIGVDLDGARAGTVLFADIAGFTALAQEAAALLGARAGADTITETLDRLYRAVADPVADFGGSIIEFLGDAFVAWFEGGDEAAVAAIGAAQTMQLAAAGLEPTFIGPTAHRLALKIGVGSGIGIRCTIGDPDLMRFESLAGPALAAALQCERHCGPGQIVVDAATLANASARPTAEHDTGRGIAFTISPEVPRRPRPQPGLPRVSAADALIGVPAAVRPALVAGMISADLRPAVALFMAVDVPGDDVDRLDAVTRWAQHVIHSHEGVLLRSGSGDKGTYLVAGFGAPVGIDRIAQQSMAAASALVAVTQSGANIREVRIGVSAGTVYSGAYGGKSRRTISILGASVNRAARLMETAAPGTVQVDAALADSLQATYGFDEPTTIQLRGFEQPVEVRVLRHGQARARDVSNRSLLPLVDRRTELARALELLDRPGASTAMVVVGEAGIGKSRLLAELRQAAGQRLIPLLSGGGDVTQSLAPYHAFQPVYRQLLGVDSPVAEESLAARVDRVLKRRPELLPAVAQLGVVVPVIRGREAPTAGPPQDHSAALLDLLIEIVVEGLGNVPRAMLAIDDAHWFDGSSWRLVAALHERLPNLHIVLTSRDFAPPLDFACERIALEPLGADDSLSLAKEALDAASLSPELAAEFTEKGGGLPLFLVELAGALAASGEAVVDNGVAVLRGHRSSGVPNTLQEVVVRRVDALTPNAHQLLRAASVAGTRGPTALLAGMVDGDAALLDQAMTELDSESLIDLTPDGWSFRHALIADVVYDTMLERQRRQLHTRAADALLAHRDLAGPVTIAHHLECAQRLDEAVPLILEAAGGSIGTGAYRDADTLLRRGLGFMAGRNDLVAKQARVQLLAMLGSVLIVTAGQGSEELKATFDEALALCETLETTPDIMGVLFGLSAYYMFRGSLEVSRSLALRCLELSTGLGIASGRDNAHMMLANIAVWSSDFEAGDLHAREVLARTSAEHPQETADLPKFAQHPVVTVSIAQSLGLAIRGRAAEALEMVVASVALARDLAHPYNIALAIETEALVQLELRNLAAADAAAKRLGDISRQHGFPMYVVVSDMVRGAVLARSGDAAAGVRLLESANAGWFETGCRLSGTFGASHLADALIRAGRVDDAIEVVDRALSGQTGTEETLYFGELACVGGRASSLRIVLGGGAAEERLRHALTLTEASGAHLHHLRAATALARELERSDSVAEARHLLTEALARFASLGERGSDSDIVDVVLARSVLEALSNPSG